MSLQRYIPGANPTYMRNLNERLCLSLIKSSGEIASAEIARRTGLSAQTASVITRALEAEHLIVKGQPQRGKVGKPVSPVRLNPDGAFSVGLKIGRRGADLVMLDLAGRIRGSLQVPYQYPTPDIIHEFTRSGIDTLTSHLSEAHRVRITGIGVGAPFELWNWLDAVDAPADLMADWKVYDFARDFAEFTDLPVEVANDATMACSAELSSGTSQTPPNFAYFYVGSFIGGGLVLNNAVFRGPTGNAAAFGTIPVSTEVGPGNQLINHASIYMLERRIEDRRGVKHSLWGDTADWDRHDDLIDLWIHDVAEPIASAAIAVTAVTDVSAIVIDGGFPGHVRDRLVERVLRRSSQIDTRGIRVPDVMAGTLGRQAGALGAAYQTIISEYFLEGLSN